MGNSSELIEGTHAAIMEQQQQQQLLAGAVVENPTCARAVDRFLGRIATGAERARLQTVVLDLAPPIPEATQHSRPAHSSHPSLRGVPHADHLLIAQLIPPCCTSISLLSAWKRPTSAQWPSQQFTKAQSLTSDASKPSMEQIMTQVEEMQKQQQQQQQRAAHAASIVQAASVEAALGKAGKPRPASGSVAKSMASSNVVDANVTTYALAYHLSQVRKCSKEIHSLQSCF
jgi:hypothetical protein